MVKKSICSLFISIIFFACTDEISYHSRDEILDNAYEKIGSRDTSTVIEGIRIIKKYPIHGGTTHLLSLWEKNISITVEKEVLSALHNFEVFRESDTFIKEVFDKYYNKNTTLDKKNKLIRLLQYTNAENSKDLIKRIANDIKMENN